MFYNTLLNAMKRIKRLITDKIGYEKQAHSERTRYDLE